MAKRTLSSKDEKEARALYDEFWRMYPTQPNPSDINTPEKASFLILKGFQRISLMQRARKQRYPFTKIEPTTSPQRSDTSPRLRKHTSLP